MDYFTAIHIGTGVPAGTVICGSDNFMATTKFDATFTGVAAHAGGKPEEGRNALLAAAQSRARAAQHCATQRRGFPRECGSDAGGSGRNVVPAHALLKVETRGESEAINQYVFERAQSVITGAAALYGVTAEMRLMGLPPPALRHLRVDYLRQQVSRARCGTGH